MSTSSALDSFLDKWRTRWPEWSVAEPFIAPDQRALVLAWFALLQEFDDVLNIAGDPMPADAKLAWWGEELRSWAGQRSRHPLGRTLEPVRAPWIPLADALPGLMDARAVPADAAQARQSLAAYAQAVAAVEAVMFNWHGRGDAASPIVTQTLAQRLFDSGVAAIPRSVAGDDTALAQQQWGQQLLAQWPARVAGPRPRRIWAAMARARQQARAGGATAAPKPIITLWRIWWAARG